MSQSYQILSAGAPRGEEHLSPSLAGGARGVWTAWQAYHAGQERILARYCAPDGSLGPLEQVTAARGRHASPYVALSGGQPLVVWLAGDGDGERHQVVWARRTPNGWAQPDPVAPGHSAALQLHATSSGERGQAVWCEVDGPQTYTLWTAQFNGRRWSTPWLVTPEPGWVHRPEVALAPGGCWIAWDTYDGHTYAVCAAFVSDGGHLTSLERVSPIPTAEGLMTPAAWQFVPSIAVDAAGAPWVAWLCRQDVANEEGVVDQWPTVRVARRGPAGWQVVRDAAGGADLAQLAWGMLAYQGHGVWGYLGRRRKPLLVGDPEQGVWLLWERKEHHDGTTAAARGVLCGRHLDGGAAGQTCVVASGPRCYVPGAMEMAGGRRRLWVAFRTPPDVSSLDVGLSAYSLAAARPFTPHEDWTGWRPVLVDEPRPAKRPSAMADERTLRLYWADLHVHTGLSGDAEGHVDEIIAYARDKANLDVMAISDNDWSHVSLTASDWAATRHYVRHFHEDGRFVLLPAYEWTYRPAATGQPNHRTVIGTGDHMPILRHQDVDPGDDPLAALARFAAGHDLLLHVHHEQWELTEPPAETNWEVCSGWGSHLAHPEWRQKYHDALAAGRKLGFAGNSDNHRRNPGLGGALTGIWATALTREAILEALRRRRCFATDGSRIAVRFWAGGAFMGQETASAGAPHIRWEVSAPQPPAMVTLVRDGEAIQDWHMDGTTMTAEYEDARCLPGEHFYYLAVEQTTPWREWPSNVAIARGPHTWCSPVWVRCT